MKLHWTCLFLLGCFLASAQVEDYPSSAMPVTASSAAECGENFPAERNRAMAEWEEIEAIVISWEGFTNILTEIVRAAQPECKIFIISKDEAFVYNWLATNGVDPDWNIKIIDENYNSIWIRDYGPNTVYRNEASQRHLVDWIYNRGDRPADDEISRFLADEIQSPIHCLNNAPTDLVHSGGNFMTDGMGTAFSTDIILKENGPGNDLGVSNHSENDIDIIMKESMGIHKYIKLDTLPYDLIHHMDMHMKLLDEETLLVGQYPDGVADGPQIEANLNYILDNYVAPSGNPYRIIRIPMPPSDLDNNYPPYGAYRTYTNALILNRSILVPVYNIEEDSEALAIWKKAMPGYQIKPIICNGLVDFFGAIHCVTKEIGVRAPLWIGHAKPWSGCNNDVTRIKAQVDHFTGIHSVKLKYWTNAPGSNVQEIEMMRTVGKRYEAEIEPLTEMGDSLFYFIEALAANNKTITRPMPAPEGYFQLPIIKCLSGINEKLSWQSNWSVFPNPATQHLTVTMNSEDFAEHYQIRLSNSLGELFATRSTKSTNGDAANIYLEFDELSSGIYFLSIGDGKNWSTKKVMINNNFK